MLLRIDKTAYVFTCYVTAGSAVWFTALEKMFPTFVAHF